MSTRFTLPKQVPLPKAKDALASRFMNDEYTLRHEFYAITVRDLEQRYKEDHLCKHSKAEISHKEAFTKQLLTWLCCAYTELEATDSEIKELAGQHLAVYNKKWDADVAKDRQRIRTTLEAIDGFWEIAKGIAEQKDQTVPKSLQRTFSDLLKILQGYLDQFSKHICGNLYEMNASSEVAGLKLAIEKSIRVIDLHSWNLDDPEPQWPDLSTYQPPTSSAESVPITQASFASALPLVMIPPHTPLALPPPSALAPSLPVTLGTQNDHCPTDREVASSAGIAPPDPVPRISIGDLIDTKQSPVTAIPAGPSTAGPSTATRRIGIDFLLQTPLTDSLSQASSYPDLTAHRPEATTFNSMGPRHPTSYGPPPGNLSLSTTSLGGSADGGASLKRPRSELSSSPSSPTATGSFGNKAVRR